MSWVALIGAGASLAAGSMQKGGGGGAGAASAPAPSVPMDFSPEFGAVTFGPRYLGTDAVAAAPTIETAIKTQSWVKVALWGIAGLVGIVAIAALVRRKKG